MAITEVYNNPTVKEVIFQIVFPNYFSMESKIGEFQLKIMERFPKSALLIQNQFLIAQSAAKINLSGTDEGIHTKKIWQFKSQEEDVILHVTSDSLDISSSKHKTYNNANAANKFRDTIDFLVENFLVVIPFFKISKMGLRYTDDCPLPEDLSVESFLEYYNSFIHFSKFTDLKNIDLLDFNSVINSNGITVRYKETLNKIEDKYKYALDFDGQKFDIKTSEYLNVLDQIHEEIVGCYENIIKEPVIKIMQK